ncbi:MAG: hypothetical protein FWF46_06190 [Oscillospiraceae bacterium]|nr:hypothetical protein [Oscillospiraceae bacterium]
MKGQRGITLIALIITVIVLLILAGVAITQLQPGGIFDRTTNAVNQYDAAANNEATQINDLTNIMDNYMPNNL